MPTRNENQDLPEFSAFTWFPNGNWDDPEDVPDPIPDWHRTIAIERVFEAYDGPNPTKGNSWTSFTHYKRVTGTPTGTVTLPRVMGVWTNSKNAYWSAKLPVYYGWYKHDGFGPAFSGIDPMYLSGATNDNFVMLPSSLSTHVGRGLAAMMPGVKAEMSLVNSVIELKDFKGLVRQVQAKYAYFKKMTAELPASYWGKQTLTDLKLGWKRYIASVKKRRRNGQLSAYSAEKASQTYLQWSFAIAPLVSDAYAVMRALGTLEKKINNLITNEGRVRIRHWSHSEDITSSKSGSYPFTLGPGFNPEVVTYSPDCSGALDWEASAVSAHIHVELKYNYNLSQYQREHARLLGLLDSFGVQANPAIIWNALKYTFLIDWVVNVSSYLDQFKVANMEPQTNVLGALWSVTTHRTIDFTKRFIAINGMGSDATASLPRITETGYTRRTFMPTRSSLSGSGLSPRELTLGAALVFARRRQKAR